VSGLAADVRASLSAAGSSGERAERIVAGDFNGTPDGHIVGALSGVMADSWASSSHGRGGTWPTDSVLGKLGKIRLDNLLHTDGLTCIASGVGGETGSDHLPTWARYVRVRGQGPASRAGVNPAK
jgi:endonuclease/exonuclease/phosphatase (EEP) superfamily protein YafD